jgi:hypothetical protein
MSTVRRAHREVLIKEDLKRKAYSGVEVGAYCEEIFTVPQGFIVDVLCATFFLEPLSIEDLANMFFCMNLRILGTTRDLPVLDSASIKASERTRQPGSRHTTKSSKQMTEGKSMEIGTRLWSPGTRLVLIVRHRKIISSPGCAVSKIK